MPTSRNFSSELQRVFANAFWLFLDKGYKLLLTVIVTAIIVPYLGPERYGALNYALAFVALFGVLASQGLDQAIVKILVMRREQAHLVLAAVSLLRLAGGLLVILLSVLTAFILERDDPEIVSLVLVLSFSFLSHAFDFPQFWFQSEQAQKWNALARAAGLTIASSLRIYLVVIKAPLMAFAVVHVVEMFAIAFFYQFFYFLTGGIRPQLRKSVNVLSSILGQNWPLFASACVTVAYGRLDQIFLGSLLSVKEVGLYSAALRLFEYVNVVPMITLSAIFPLLVKVFSQDTARAAGKAMESKKDVNRIIVAIQLLSVMVPLVAWLGGDFAVRKLFGSEFEYAIVLFRLVVFTFPVIMFSVLRFSLFTIWNITGLNLGFEILVLVISVISNQILIRTSGTVGAAYAMLFTSYASIAIAALVSRNMRRALRIFILGVR